MSTLTREEAWKQLTAWTETDSLRRHARAVEVTMRAAALAYGPVLASSEKTRPMFEAILNYSLRGEAPLLRELGINPASVVYPVVVRLEVEPGTKLEPEMPLRFEVNHE